MNVVPTKDFTATTPLTMNLRTKNGQCSSEREVGRNIKLEIPTSIVERVEN